MAADTSNVFRRSFLKTGAGALGSAALGSNPLAVQGADPPARPNLIFMTTDGHRPDALSLNGNPILQTPNFDRIGPGGCSVPEFIRYQRPEPSLAGYRADGSPYP